MKYGLKCPHCLAEVSPYACGDAVAIQEKYGTKKASTDCGSCKRKIEVVPITEYILLDPERIFDWEDDIPF